MINFGPARPKEPVARVAHSAVPVEGGNTGSRDTGSIHPPTRRWANAPLDDRSFLRIGRLSKKRAAPRWLHGTGNRETTRRLPPGSISELLTVARRLTAEGSLGLVRPAIRAPAAGAAAKNEDCKSRIYNARSFVVGRRERTGVLERSPALKKRSVDRSSSPRLHSSTRGGRS